MIHTMADKTEIKHVLIDSTIARAHQHSSGLEKNGPQARERSELRFAVDDAGRPLRLIATKGQVSDAT
jgi:hypothetical protein